MVLKKTERRHIPLILGILLACILLVSNPAWADETSVISEDNPSMFIKEGGLPKSPSAEVEEILAGTPGRVTTYSGLVYSTEMTFEDYLVSQIEQKKTSIDVTKYQIKKDDIYAAYTAVINKHPELFYVNTSLSYNYTSDGYVTTMYVSYKDYDCEAIYAEANKVLAMIDDGMTDIEKVLFIHDYLCVDIEYAYEDYLNGTVSGDAHSLKGALLDKKAVCDGYSSAFQYYMALLDIPCNIVTNSNHAWNQVYVDGKWYFVDVTWDDPVWDYYGNVGHDYFMKSTDSFLKHDWTTASAFEPCTDTKFDSAFWNGVSTQMILKDGYWYYVDNSGNLNKHSFSIHSITEAGTQVTSIGGTWRVIGSSSYYTGCYAKIAKYGNKICYSQPDGVYYCNFDGSGKTRLSPVVDTSTGCVYGMKISGNQLYYQVAVKPYIQERTNYSIEIRNYNIGDCDIALSENSFTYNGTKQYPKKITVSLNGTQLVEGNDYKVTYNYPTSGTGTVTITITGIGEYTGTKEATYTIEKKSQTVSVPETNISKTYGDAAFSLGASVKAGTITYKSGNTNVVTVDSSGKVTIKGAGQTTITIKTAGTATYKAASKTVTVKVSKAVQKISVTKETITKTYGNSAFSLGAKASAGGKLTYASGNTSIAVVSTTGQVTIKGAGSVNLTIRAAETSNYKSAVKTVKLSVYRKNISGTVKISSSQYVYNGKEKKPTVTIANLTQNRDYKVTYSNNINIGTAKITVTGMGNYKGTLTKTFKIVPAQAKITSAASTGTGKIQVKWSKQSCGGYEIVFSKKSDFSSTAKKVTVTGSTSVSKTVTGFTSGQTYYVKIRAYKVVNGQKYYGAYSSKLSVKVK